MKVTIFNGSPRGNRGNTQIMAEAFTQGLMRGGAEVENILLVEKNIKHCLGCFSCWAKTPGKCIIKDEMAPLIDKYMKSDIVIYATPLYTDYVTGIMKDFMDRLLPIVCPEFEKDANGQTRHKKRYEKYPDMVMMSNCGFPEAGQFEVLKIYCERKMRFAKTNIISQIYRSQGELLKTDNAEFKPLIEKYKDLLREAGEEIAKNKRLPPELMEALEKPIIPEEEYARNVNSAWEKEGH
ncbi:MAG: flavodoxin family protein [Candidatus Omnitrophota bacterium]|jgi:putative NADPH-quinone reductase